MKACIIQANPKNRKYPFTITEIENIIAVCYEKNGTENSLKDEKETANLCEQIKQPYKELTERINAEYLEYKEYKRLKAKIEPIEKLFKPERHGGEIHGSNW